MIDLQLIGFITVGVVFSVGLLILGIYLLNDNFVNNKITKPPKQKIKIMNIEEKKIVLLKHLKREKEGFTKHGHDTTEHDYCILYIEEGVISSTHFKYELLYSCVNDFESIYNYYTT